MLNHILLRVPVGRVIRLLGLFVLLSYVPAGADAPVDLPEPQRIKSANIDSARIPDFPTLSLINVLTPTEERGAIAHGDFVDGVFARVRVRMDLLRRGTGTGAWKLGLRYSAHDASAFGSGNSAGAGRRNVAPALTPTNQAKNRTLGLAWIPAANTRMLLNLADTRFSAPVTVINSGNPGGLRKGRAITLQAQFDF